MAESAKAVKPLVFMPPHISWVAWDIEQISSLFLTPSLVIKLGPSIITDGPHMGTDL